MSPMPNRVVLRSDGTTTCCNCGVMATSDKPDEPFCSACQQPVQLSIVKTDGGEFLMMAGASPCGDPMPLPRRRKRRRTKPRKTARHGRGKATRR